MRVSSKRSAVIYCRVSGHNKAEGGASLQVQENACREYAKRLGCTMQKVFHEKGTVAGVTDHLELKNAIKFCSKQRPKFFIVYKRNFLARNVGDFMNIRAQVTKSGTKLRSATETEPVEQTPQERLQEAISAAMSEFHKSMRSLKRIKADLARIKATRFKKTK